MTDRLQPTSAELNEWARGPACPFCLIEHYDGRIPNTFDPTRDAELCDVHAKEHAPHWHATQERWIVVASTGSLSLHCTVPNPKTGRLKDPPEGE